MSEIIDIINNGETEESSYIMVIGVGGGGSNAVQYMYDIGVHNVNFLVCNTDAQALRRSNMPVKVQLGSKVTKGLGAGNQPEKGREAAKESQEEIVSMLTNSNARMVFVTAGMGGGTGTGAAPVIAQVAKEMGILTVGIVTIPFRLEGPKRLRQAEAGLEELKQYVDSLIVIDNENICKMYGDLDFSEAFSKADDILAIAAKGIAEAITKEHKVNVDFADVFSTMSNSGIALLGYASAEIGAENIAIDLTEEALKSPLLNQNNIKGAQDIMINISWNKKELKMGELHAIIGHVQAAAGSNANIIWGAGSDSAIKENTVSLIIIATRFGSCEKIDLGGNIQTNNDTVKERPTDAEISKLSEHDIETSDVSIIFSEHKPVLSPEKIEYVSLDDDTDELKSEKEEVVEVPDMVIRDEDEATAATEAASDDVKEPAKEVVSQPVKPVSTPAPSVAAAEKPATDASKAKRYTIDELESMPAYERRQALIDMKLELEKNS